MCESREKIGNQANKTVEIWMVRHGETIFNVKGLIQGWSDSPLTLNGINATTCLGVGLKNAKVKFQAIYSSDLTRCLETSQILLTSMESNLRIQADKRLRELNTGDGEGDCIEEYLKEYPDTLNFEKSTGAPNGENWQQVWERVFSALRDIGKKYKNKGGKVLIVSHTMVISAIMGYLNPSQKTIQSIPNSSVTVFEYKNGEISLKRQPDTFYSEMGLDFISNNSDFTHTSSMVG